MYVENTGFLAILHIPIVITNRDGSTVVRGFSGTSLVSHLEVDIRTDSFLGTVTTTDPEQIDPPNYVLPAPNVKT